MWMSLFQIGYLYQSLGYSCSLIPAGQLLDYVILDGTLTLINQNCLVRNCSAKPLLREFRVNESTCNYNDTIHTKNGAHIHLYTSTIKFVNRRQYFVYNSYTYTCLHPRGTKFRYNGYHNYHKLFYNPIHGNVIVAPYALLTGKEDNGAHSIVKNNDDVYLLAYDYSLIESFADALDNYTDMNILPPYEFAELQHFYHYNDLLHMPVARYVKITKDRYINLVCYSLDFIHTQSKICENPPTYSSISWDKLHKIFDRNDFTCVANALKLVASFESVANSDITSGETTTSEKPVRSTSNPPKSTIQPIILEVPIKPGNNYSLHVNRLHKKRTNNDYAKKRGTHYNDRSTGNNRNVRKKHRIYKQDYTFDNPYGTNLLMSPSSRVGYKLSRLLQYRI